MFIHRYSRLRTRDWKQRLLTPIKRFTPRCTAKPVSDILLRDSIKR